jgi:hypothetical protein
VFYKVGHTALVALLVSGSCIDGYAAVYHLCGAGRTNDAHAARQCMSSEGILYEWRHDDYAQNFVQKYCISAKWTMFYGKVYPYFGEK